MTVNKIIANEMSLDEITVSAMLICGCPKIFYNLYIFTNVFLDSLVPSSQTVGYVLRTPWPAGRP
jgi:hypothetical protein